MLGECALFIILAQHQTCELGCSIGGFREAQIVTCMWLYTAPPPRPPSSFRWGIRASRGKLWVSEALLPVRLTLIPFARLPAFAFEGRNRLLWMDYVLLTVWFRVPAPSRVLPRGISFQAVPLVSMAPALTSPHQVRVDQWRVSGIAIFRAVQTADSDHVQQTTEHIPFLMVVSQPRPRVRASGFPC